MEKGYLYLEKLWIHVNIALSSTYGLSEEIENETKGRRNGSLGVMAFASLLAQHYEAGQELYLAGQLTRWTKESNKLGVNNDLPIAMWSGIQASPFAVSITYLIWTKYAIHRRNVSPPHEIFFNIF